MDQLTTYCSAVNALRPGVGEGRLGAIAENLSMCKVNFERQLGCSGSIDPNGKGSGKPKHDSLAAPSARLRNEIFIITAVAM